MENNNSLQAQDISIGYGVLSFFIPIVGIILFFVWKDDSTKGNVKSRTLVPALVAIGLGVVANIILMVISAAVFSAY